MDGTLALRIRSGEAFSCHHRGRCKRRRVLRAAVLWTLVAVSAVLSARRSRSCTAFIPSRARGGLSRLGPSGPPSERHRTGPAIRKFTDGDQSGQQVVTRRKTNTQEGQEGGSRYSAAEWLSGVRNYFVLLMSIGVIATSVFLGASSLTRSTTEQREQMVFERWYTEITEVGKKAASKVGKFGTEFSTKKEGRELVPTSVVDRIRGLSDIMDSCQRDIYEESWLALATYPAQLEGYTPTLDAYMSMAWPDEGPGTAAGQVRKALLFEEARLMRSVAEFGEAVDRRSIRDVEKSFADMSLAYDRYLKAGNLYAGYDPVASTEVFYKNIDDSQLVYTPRSLEQPRIRDEVLVIQGPDKGKVGQVIWLGRNPDSDEVVTATVKLTSNPTLGGETGRGFKEVKSYPYSWIAVTRTTETNYLLDVALAGIAAIFSCAVTYPLDSLKSRMQSGLPLLPKDGLPGLFSGLTFNLCREVPNSALYLGGFNLLTRQFCLLPFVNANNPNLKLAVMIPAGILAFLSGTFIRAPFEILNKQIQTGAARTNEEAIQNVFFRPPQSIVWSRLEQAWVLCVVRGIPFGALQCTFYEFFKDRLELVSQGLPLALHPFLWGALAGLLTGYITNPPDVLLTRISELDKVASPPRAALPFAPAGGNYAAEPADAEKKNVLDKLYEAFAQVNREEGPAGFFKGATFRALYFAPEACLWFAAYEFLRSATADLVL